LGIKEACCARATTGHVAAAPNAPRNVRRLMPLPMRKSAL
jgi:hypothetical protein